MEKICEIERKSEGRALARDIAFFTVGFLLTRCHLAFGAHPIGLAFLAALPVGVWSALIGAAIGGISMGLRGIIFAAASAVTVFLRAAVSIDKTKENQGLFSEKLLLRMAVSLLGGFVAAVYEVLLSGLSEKTLAFGILMILAPPLLTFIFSGLFSTGIGWNELIRGPRDLLSLRGLTKKERYDVIFFILSAMISIFFISLSLRGVDAFGISALYIFSGVITLLVAKRFGAIYGLAAGFVSALPGSALLSVSFALAGLVAGGIFSLGVGYAIILSGVALAAFSGYSSGLGGLVSTLPEYVISTAIALPLFRLLGAPKAEDSAPEENHDAEDMLGTMALVYRKEYSGAVDALGNALGRLSGVMNSHADEMRDDTDDYRLFAALVEAARENDRSETAVDNSMTEPLTAAIKECGFDGVIRAFGKRRPHFILAGTDSGGRISSFEIRKSIENAAGVKLSAPQCYRKGQTALMECGVRRRLAASFAIAEMAGSDTEVSGDIPICFETEDDSFCALLCDGMGSGAVARETATFTSDFLRSAVESRIESDTLMLLLNRAVKARREECSSTVDLFRLDLIRGSGEFVKSGAAPSFIKRDGSIFRIRSHTAPIGLLSTVDSERTKVDIKPGDYVILMSDGVSDESEDAPWLLLLLGEDAPKSPKEYADRIIREARKNRLTRDDMSVIVIQVSEI